jgi:hypothetical protein
MVEFGEFCQGSCLCSGNLLNFLFHATHLYINKNRTNLTVISQFRYLAPPSFTSLRYVISLARYF